MFSVVQVMDDNTYGEEIAFEANREDALDIQATKHDDEGIVSDVLELKTLKDMYGVDVEGKAWVMVSEMSIAQEVA
jgi:hypothetical protein